MTNTRQILLGAFFTVVLGLLGYYTLFMTNFSLFGERHEMVVHFPQANGLRDGDSVLVAGLRQGRVGTLTYDPKAGVDRRITVTLLLDEQVSLREGFRIFIEDATLLGGRQVYIDPGPAEGAVVDPARTLFGAVRGNALAGLGELVEENRAAVASILSNFDELVSGVREGRGVLGGLLTDEEMRTQLNEGLGGARTTFDNLASLTSDVRAGKGVVGKLFTDDELAGKLQEVTDNLTQISQDFKVISGDLEQGKGALGRILRDEALGEDVAQAVASIREIAGRINAGEGTLGRLVVDDKIAKDIETTIAGIKDVTDRISAGEGLLGKLVTDEEVYGKLSQIVDDLAASSAALRNAEGTLGKLLMDRELYDEVVKAIGILNRSLEEFREAAPVTTFTAVLFGAF